MKNLLLRFLSKVLGFLALIVITVCLYSLARFLYFQPHRIVQPKGDMVDERFTKARSHEMGAGEFHVSEEPISTDVSTAPMCLRCHGNFCHNKSEMFRSYYNMHTFFISCEACHIRVEQGSEITFKWYDDKSGKELMSVSGEYQNYGAKIIPVKKVGRSLERLDKFPEETLALDFMKNKDTYAAEQKEAIKKQLMKHISPKPVMCEECHSTQSYLNYRDLGYNETRSEELSRIEIVKMIKEYNDFKFPVMFRSGKK